MRLKQTLTAIVMATGVSAMAQQTAQEPYDLANLSFVSAGNKLILGIGDVPFKKYSEPTQEEMYAFNIQRNDIRSSYITARESEDKTKQSYHMVLVPVGINQEKIDQMFPNLLLLLDEIFSGVDIKFSYLKKNAPIAIQYADFMPMLKEGNNAQQVFDKLTEHVLCDYMAIIVDSKGISGSNAAFPIASIAHVDRVFIIAHEIAHHLQLSDGYKRGYHALQKNGTEFFVDSSALSPNIKQAMQKVGARYAKSEDLTWEGQPVYRFYPHQLDLMDGAAFFKECRKYGEPMWWYFNPMQKEIMNSYINTVLELERNGKKLITQTDE